jgi:hypothetical protein
VDTFRDQAARKYDVDMIEAVKDGKVEHYYHHHYYYYLLLSLSSFSSSFL